MLRLGAAGKARAQAAYEVLRTASWAPYSQTP